MAASTRGDDDVGAVAAAVVEDRLRVPAVIGLGAAVGRAWGRGESTGQVTGRHSLHGRLEIAVEEHLEIEQVRQPPGPEEEVESLHDHKGSPGRDED